LTKSLARQLGPEGIRVNAVAPGAIATSIKRINGNTQENAVLGRTGRAVEVANAIYFFGSSDSSYITGQVLAVDGGRFA
jgi:NAD(P)-dependent dehydrogenase (short-subunit alcohol dehydrogenase family)